MTAGASSVRSQAAARIWLAASLAVLARMDLLHLAERRHAPEREAEIYATPGTSHVRQRLARRRAAAAGLPAPASHPAAATVTMPLTHWKEATP